MKCCDSDVHYCLTFYREQRPSEEDQAHCSCNCPAISLSALIHLTDEIEWSKSPLYCLSSCLFVPPYISIVTLSSSLSLDKWWEDRQGSMVVIQDQPSWHWPSYLSHTDIIRQGLPASHHDTQDSNRGSSPERMWHIRMSSVNNNGGASCSMCNIVSVHYYFFNCQTL